MSRAKPWPTVANRHRIDAMFLAGAIRIRTGVVLYGKKDKALIVTLREAILEGNIPLALTAISALEGHVSTIREQAKQIIDILESAPSDLPPNGRNPQGAADDP